MSTPTVFGSISLRLTGQAISGAALRLQDAKRGLVTCASGGAEESTDPDSYLHTQSTPADSWYIEHGLGFQPSVRVYSIGGREMLAEVIHLTADTVRVYFDQPTAGYAVCS
jgi:hypothetical protein